MCLIEIFCNALTLFKNNENEKGENLLSKALGKKNDDPFLAIKLTPPIFLLLKYISKQSPLHKRVQDYLKELFSRMEMEKAPLSLMARIKLAMGLMGKADSVEIDILDFFHPQIVLELFPLVFLQQSKPFKEEWFSKLKKLWNAEEGTFIGPTIYSMHEISPQDYWMRYLTNFPQGCDLPYYAALFECQVPQAIEVKEDSRFTVLRQNEFSLSFFENTSYRLEPYWRGFHLVRGFFKHHTFSVQGRVDASCVYDDGIKVTFTYPELTLERDSSTLIGFYIDRTGVDFRVNGDKALSFSLGDTITFKSGNFQINVLFSVISGSSRVTGQIIPYSRPAKGEEGGADWGVFLRPIAIDEESVFIMSIKLDFVTSLDEDAEGGKIPFNELKEGCSSPCPKK